MSLAISTQAAHSIGQLMTSVRNVRARAFVAGALMMSGAAFAGTPPGGGTGSVGAVQTRVTDVTSGFQGILFGIGGLVLSMAVMYVGYSMAFAGKKWSDVANVAYGATIAGMGSMLVGWLFS
jgi:hypothetical protein